MAKNAISACRILSPCLRAGILVALAPWASCFLGLLLPGHMQCKNLSRPEPPGPAPQLPPCSRGHGRLRHSGLLRLWTRSNSFLFPGHLTVHLAHKATLLPLLLRTPGIVGAELRPSGSFFRPRATGGVQPWGKGYKSVFQQMIPEPFSLGPFPILHTFPGRLIRSGAATLCWLPSAFSSLPCALSP